MSSQKKDFAGRKSFRCRVPDKQQGAVLKVGGRRFPVRLFNESAGGAAAWADQDPGVKADDVVQLSTTFGRFQARVAYIAEIEPVEPEGPRFRVGFEWLRELEMPFDEQDRPHGLLARS